MSAALTLNVRGGSQICVPPDLEQAATYVLLEQEDWFEDEIRFLREWLQPGMRAADLGANYGVYTAAMARSVGPGGRIWSFEPTPGTLELFRRTVALNGFSQVEIHPCALSDRTGTLSFGVGAHSELNRVMEAGSDALELIQVPAVTLDDVAGREDWERLSFIKMDVEGHEPQVIAGGARFLAQSAPLVMLEVLSGGRFASGTLEQLGRLGYQFFRLIPGLHALAPLDQSELDSFHLNLFACKPPTGEKLADEGWLSPVDEPSRSRPQPQAWEEFVGAAPYAVRFRARWTPKAGFLSGPAVRTYYDALASFARSRDRRQSASERLGWLRRAFDGVCRALEDQSSVPRLMSYARLAAELGLREAAAMALRQAAAHLAEKPRLNELEPFLAPSLRHERLAVEAEFQDWAECCIAEQLEKLRAFSSLYGGAATDSVLAPALSKPFRSPETERRRQLLRMRAGAQHGPEAHRLLCEASEENLNPGYWCFRQKRG